MLQILIAISLVCILALIWVTLAIARHIAASRKADRWNSDDIPGIVPRAEPAAVVREQQIVPEFRRELIAAAQVNLRVQQSDLHQSVGDISAGKSWTMPAKPLRTRLLTREPVFRSIVAGGQSETDRMPPASRRGVMRRLDPAYFNKDSGDLTDPYEQPRTGIRTFSKQINRNRR